MLGYGSGEGDDTFKNDKLQFMMILIGVFNIVFLITCGYLVYKVYKLVKTTDLPQLFSIVSIFMSIFCKLSTLCIMLIHDLYYIFQYAHSDFHSKYIVIMIYIILFVLWLRAEPESYLKDSNIVRITNFIAIIFFSFALVFDLYKW